MSDDQDGCEWVSVSSGTTRVVPDQRPLNGCVCVCLFITIFGTLSFPITEDASGVH